MLDASTIKKLFKELNKELRKKDLIGEIGLCGGAVMCLVFDVRKATKDLDEIFEPTKEIRKAANKIAKKFNLDRNWLNDGAKAFFHVSPLGRML